MKDDRNLALDFARGMLLVSMFFLHCIDELAPYSILGKSVRFTSGGFVLLVGFILSNIYLKKYNLRESRIYLRLISRGIKLLIIVVILNIAVTLILRQPFDGKELSIATLIDYIFSIVFSTKERISFYILIPITYLMLLVGILLLILKEKFRLVVISTAAVLVAYCSITFLFTKPSAILKLLSIGFIGVTLGFMNINDLNNKLLKYMYAVIVIYIMHLVLLHLTPSVYYPVFFVSVLISVTFFYLLGLKLRPQNIIVDKILLLGHYSLLTYMAHIVTIAGIRIFMYNILQINRSYTSLSINFVITTAMMIWLSKFTEYNRKKIPFTDKLYRLIFE